MRLKWRSQAIARENNLHAEIATKRKGQVMKRNLFESMKAAREAVYLGTDALTGGKSDFFPIPPERPRNAEAKHSGRNGWEIDRENLANDWRRVESGLRNIINQRGAENDR